MRQSRSSPRIGTKTIPDESQNVTHSDCPADRIYWQFVADELEANERAAIEHHLSRCETCRSRLVQTLAETEPLRNDAAPPELKAIARNMVPPTRAARRNWLPLAAAVLIVVGLGVVWGSTNLFDRGPDPAIDRAGSVKTPSGSEDTLREVPGGLTLDLTAPKIGAIATSDVTRFEWRKIDNARRYDFLLVNEIGDVIHESSTTEASIDLDWTSLEIATSGIYYWSVRAHRRDGTTVESEPRQIGF